MKIMGTLEITHLLMQFEGRTATRDKALMALMIGAGLRPSEASELGTDDVWFVNNVCHVEAFIRRGGGYEEIVLSPWASWFVSDWLEQRHHPSIWLFPGQLGDHISVSGIEKIVRGSGYSCHDLRRTFHAKVSARELIEMRSRYA